MKQFQWILLILYVLVGIGASLGGISALLNPEEPMPGVGVELLKQSPFENFFIPGLILFFLFGMGNLVAALSYFSKRPIQTYFGIVLGSGLVIFIAVQCWMLQMVNFLHVLFFVIGLFQVIGSLYIFFIQNAWLVNLIKEVKIKKSSR